MSFWKDAEYLNPTQGAQQPARTEANQLLYSLSIRGTFNYILYKGLSIGAGVEPTWYFDSGINNFDTPLVGKAAYNLGKFEVGLSYKHGLMNALKGTNENIKSGKFRDVQLSVFIPF